MANNKTLIERMKKLGFTMAFKDRENRGCGFYKGKGFNKKETFLARNINQIRSITEAEWNEANPAEAQSSS